MHCRTCSKELVDQAVVCVGCGCPPFSGNKYCSTCGAETNPAATVCVKCGSALRGGTTRASSRASGGGEQIVASDPPKDPVMMCVLSVLVVGLGQIILGQTTKGISILVGTILMILVTCGYGVLLAPFVWIFAGVDAYLIANKLKNGKPVGQWEFF